MQTVNTAGRASPSRKLIPIQALRALAALSVAIVHLTYAFARYVDHRLIGLPDADHVAQAAVALFFVISGCVMVISSGPLFGTARGTVRFWRRRAVRVLPPYWIATGVMVAAMALIGRNIDFGYALRSLVFIPAAAADGTLFKLYLWPGWTLLYELVFYALFGAFVALGRTGAVAATSAALACLVAAGVLAPPEALILTIVTRPILLLFVAGMVMGLALERQLAAPDWLRWILLIAGAVLFARGDYAGAPLGFGYLAGAGLPAILVFLAAMSGPLRLPLAPVFAVLGDASYAIYLFHVPFGHAWMWVFQTWLGEPGGSLGFLAMGVPLLIALSIAFHYLVERPLTARLNAFPRQRPVEGAGLGRTLAP